MEYKDMENVSNCGIFLSSLNYLSNISVCTLELTQLFVPLFTQQKSRGDRETER